MGARECECDRPSSPLSEEEARRKAFWDGRRAAERSNARNNTTTELVLDHLRHVAWPALGPRKELAKAYARRRPFAHGVFDGLFPRSVLDEVGAENPVVVGHSLGGMVVSVLAAITPVRAVVNVDQPLALAGFKDALTPLEPMLRGDAFAQVMAGMFDGYAGPLPEEEKARVGALRTPVQQVVLDIWSPVFDQTVEELDALVRDMLDGLEAPYLALHGDDPGPDYRAWLTDVIPQAQLEVWDGMAHYPHLMEPARFAERVRSFVNDSCEYFRVRGIAHKHSSSQCRHVPRRRKGRPTPSLCWCVLRREGDRLPSSH